MNELTNNTRPDDERDPGATSDSLEILLPEPPEVEEEPPVPSVMVEEETAAFIAVIGGACTGFRLGKNVKSGAELLSAASFGALKNAGLSPAEVDLVIDCGPSELCTLQGNAGLHAQTAGWFAGRPHLALAASTIAASEAIRIAGANIAAGLAEVVLIRGVSLYSHWFSGGGKKGVEQAQFFLARGLDQEWELPLTSNPLAPYGFLASRYTLEYQANERQRALIAIKNHKNALQNPFAAVPMKLSLNDVLQSPQVAGPLRSLETSAWPDGAACILLADESRARKLSQSPVWITGLGLATTSPRLGDRVADGENFTHFESTRFAAKDAYAQAGITDPSRQVAFFEVDDTTTLAEILACEDLGLCEPGRGGTLIENGTTDSEGRMPVNVSGGLLGMGAGEGAPGLARVYEIFLQLTNAAGKRQLPQPGNALFHETAGYGAAAAVTLFSRK